MTNNRRRIMIRKSFKALLYLAIFFFLAQFAYALNIVKLSPGYYPNTSVGRALSLAYIYVGKPDLDPTIAGNQKTLSVQQEDGTIVEVSQPIRTNAGGVPIYAGSPVVLLVEGDYSLKVLDSNESQVYYVPSTAYEQYLVAGNYYYPDYSEADQGVVGGGQTVTDILNEVGATEKATIYFSHNSGGNTTTYTFTTNTTITDNFNIIIEEGVILDGAGILTISGSFDAGVYQVFGSSISVNFGSLVHEILVEWMGDIDGTADDVQINAAITAASNNQIVKCFAPTYTCSSSIEMNKSMVLSIGYTTITSTADPVINIVSDTTITGIDFTHSKIQNTTDLDACIIQALGGTNRSNIIIERLYLKAAGADWSIGDRSDGDAIQIGQFADKELYEHDNILIQECYITNSKENIMLWYTKNSRIINNTFYSDHKCWAQINLWGGSGILIDGNTFVDTGDSSNAIEAGGGVPRTEKTIISNNTFIGSWEYEVIVLAGQNYLVDGNFIYSDGCSRLIEIVESVDAIQNDIKNITISNNDLYSDDISCDTPPILIQNASATYEIRDIKIDNNQIYYNGTDVTVTLINGGGGGIRNVILSNGKIENAGNGEDGIFIGSNVYDVSIKGWEIDGCGTNGIHTQSAGITGLRIQDNTVKNCGNNGFYINGDMEIFSGNIAYNNFNWGISSSGNPECKQFYGNVAYHNNESTGYDPQYQINMPTANSEVLTGTITASREIIGGNIDSSGGAVTITVRDGIYIGQIKNIVMSDATASSTVSITHHQTSDPEVATFDAVDETGVFMWTGTEWITLFATCTFL